MARWRQRLVQHSGGVVSRASSTRQFVFVDMLESSPETKTNTEIVSVHAIAGGDFKMQKQDALKTFISIVGPEHPYYKDFHEDICWDMGISPDTPADNVLTRVMDLPTWTHTGPYVALFCMNCLGESFARASLAAASACCRRPSHRNNSCGVLHSRARTINNIRCTCAHTHTHTHSLAHSLPHSLVYEIPLPLSLTRSAHTVARCMHAFTCAGMNARAHGLLHTDARTIKNV